MREKKQWNQDGFASVLSEATDVEQAARPGVRLGWFADHLIEQQARPGDAFACLDDDEVECVDPLHPGFLGMDEFPANGGRFLTTDADADEEGGVECRNLDAVVRDRLERNRGKPRVIRRPGKPAGEALTVMPPVSERTATAQPAPVAPSPVVAKPGNGKANGAVAKPITATPPASAAAKPNGGNGKPNGHLPHLPVEVWRLVPTIANGLRAGKRVLIRDLARELRLPLLRHLCRAMRAVCDFVPQADGRVEYRLRPARSR